MKVPGMFFGIGVGPGERGLIPLIAWETLKKCHIIFTPRAGNADHSVARSCLPANEIPEERFREVEFSMDSDRRCLGGRYAELAEGIPVQSRSPASLAWPSLAGQHVESKWYSWLWSGLRLRAVVDHLSKSRTSCQNRAINLQSRTYAKDITERHHTIQ